MKIQIAAMLILAGVVCQRTCSSCVVEFVTQPSSELPCNPNNRSVSLMCSISVTNITKEVALVWMGFQKGKILSFPYNQGKNGNLINSSIFIEQIYNTFDKTAISYLWCQAFVSSHLILLPPSQFIRLQAANSYKRLPQCQPKGVIAFPYQKCLFKYNTSTWVPTVRYQPIPAVRTVDSNSTNQLNSNSGCPGRYIATIVLVQFFIFATLTTIGIAIGCVIIRKYIAHVREMASQDEDIVTNQSRFYTENIELNTEIVNNHRTSLPRTSNQLERFSSIDVVNLGKFIVHKDKDDNDTSSSSSTEYVEMRKHNDEGQIELT